MPEIKIGKINLNRVQEGCAYQVTMLPRAIIGDNKFNPLVKLGVDIYDQSAREMQHFEKEFHLNGLFSAYYENMIYTDTVELKSVEIEYGGIRFTFVVDGTTSKTYKVECFTDTATLISYSVDFGSAYIYPRQIKTTSNALYAETAGSAAKATNASNVELTTETNFHEAGLYFLELSITTNVSQVGNVPHRCHLMVFVPVGWDGSYPIVSSTAPVVQIGASGVYNVEGEAYIRLNSHENVVLKTSGVSGQVTSWAISDSKCLQFA